MILYLQNVSGENLLISICYYIFKKIIDFNEVWISPLMIIISKCLTLCILDKKKKYKNDAMLLFKTASKSSLLQSKCILKPLFSINLNLFAFAMGNGAWGKDL